MPESPPEIDGDGYDERRAQLIDAARERKQHLDESQQDILDAIGEEHGGDEVEVTHAITPEHTVTLRGKLTGRLTDQFATIEDRLDRWDAFDAESGEDHPPVKDLPKTADEIATMLADLIVDEEWDKDLFYSIYEQEGLDVLGGLFSDAIEALQDARERQAGAVDGFREK